MAGATSGVPDAPPDRVGQLLDVVAYAGWTTVAFAAVSTVLTALLGWPVATGVKYGLFVFGWLTFGYGTFKLLPARPWNDDEPGPFEVDASDDTGFQALVQRLPPARFQQIPATHRLPTGVRLFLASLVTLGTSLALEQLFGIGP